MRFYLWVNPLVGLSFVRVAFGVGTRYEDNDLDSTPFLLRGVIPTRGSLRRSGHAEPSPSRQQPSKQVHSDHLGSSVPTQGITAIEQEHSLFFPGHSLMRRDVGTLKAAPTKSEAESEDKDYTAEYGPGRPLNLSKLPKGWSMEPQYSPNLTTMPLSIHPKKHGSWLVLYNTSLEDWIVRRRVENEEGIYWLRMRIPRDMWGYCGETWKKAIGGWTFAELYTPPYSIDRKFPFPTRTHARISFDFLPLGKWVMSIASLRINQMIAWKGLFTVSKGPCPVRPLDEDVWNAVGERGPIDNAVHVEVELFINTTSIHFELFVNRSDSSEAKEEAFAIQNLLILAWQERCSFKHCPPGKIVAPEPRWCNGTCQVSECCEPAPQCWEHDCGLGFRMRPHRVHYCSGQACKFEECCEKSKECTASECKFEDNWVPKEILDFCEGVKCTPEECCDQRGKCKAADCTQQGGIQKDLMPLHCGRAECLFSECCEQVQLCNPTMCDNSKGFVKNPLMADRNCTEKPCSTFCCREVGKCADIVCRSGWREISNSTRNSTTNVLLCEGEFCEEEECCEVNPEENTTSNISNGSNETTELPNVQVINKTRCKLQKKKQNSTVIWKFSTNVQAYLQNRSTQPNSEEDNLDDYRDCDNGSMSIFCRAVFFLLLVATVLEIEEMVFK